MATARRTLLRDFALSNAVYQNATMTVYLADEYGLITANLADLWSDETSQVAMLNPQTLDSEGKLPSPIYFDQDIIVVIDSIGLGQQQTGIIRPGVQTAEIDAATTLARRAIAERIRGSDPLLSNIPI